MLSTFFWKKLLARSRLARLLPAVRRRLKGGERFLHHFSDRVLAAPYADLSELARRRDVSEPDAIDLAFGSPTFAVAPSESTRLPAHRRGWPPPQGLLELRRAVADYLAADHRVMVNAHDDVLIAHGGAGAFSAAAEAFVNPGDRVVLFDPTSPLFPLLLKQRQARIRWIATETKNGSDHFSRQELGAALRGAKMIVLAQPNNPTGGVFEPQDMEYISWWSRRRDALIYHDAAFAAFRNVGWDSNPVANGQDWNPNLRAAGCADPWRIETHRHAPERTLIAGTVSKSHALTAARVGWLAGNKHLISACTLSATLQAPFVPVLCQQIALAALRVQPDKMQSIWAEFAGRRRYVADRLRSMGLPAVESSAGLFCWIPLQSLAMTGRETAERLWQEQRVLVFPGHFFGPSGSDFVRLSFAGDHGRLAEGLRRLAEFVQVNQTQPTIPPPQFDVIDKPSEVAAA